MSAYIIDEFREGVSAIPAAGISGVEFTLSGERSLELRFQRFSLSNSHHADISNITVPRKDPCFVGPSQRKKCILHTKQRDWLQQQNAVDHRKKKRKSGIAYEYLHNAQRVIRQNFVSKMKQYAQRHLQLANGAGASKD